MLENWVRWWWRCVFWWLPASRDDEAASAGEGRRGQDPAAADRPAARAQAQRQPAGGGAAPGRSEDPVPAPDDLTAIKGIGPKLQVRLNELGIRRFADLAQADADALAPRIGQPMITPERVRSWIAEASRRTG
jgi:predicted flap endonuclease-1-like 5' DNA nuclease